MIKNVFKIDYQLKRDEQGRQMLFVSSYQNNIKIEEHFAGYIDDILSKNKKQKEVIDKISKITYEIDESIKTTGGYPSDYIDDLLSILKEVHK